MLQSQTRANDPGTRGASPDTTSASGVRTRQLSYGDGQKALSPRERGQQAIAWIAPLAERFSLDPSTLDIHVHGEGALGDARAFTQGNTIHFGVSEAALGTPAGQTLIAHELAHVAQQRVGVKPPPTRTTDEALEAEADGAAEQAAAGQKVAVDLRASPSKRQNKKTTPQSGALTPAEVAAAVRWYGVHQHQYPSAVAKRIQDAVGAYPDGDIGPKTVRAIAAWQAAHGLEADGYAGPMTLTAMFGEDIRADRPTEGDQKGREDDDGEAADGGVARPDGLAAIKKTFGKPGTNISTFAMRAGADGKMINVPAHKKVGPIFQAVFEDIHKDGQSGHIHSYDGCYVYRTKRKNSKSYSTHAWGIAMDVNASSNPMKKNVKPSDSQKVLAPYFEKHGFYWGANFSDPMHFQYCTGY